MIDKIKKLVESTNYDDNRLALILIAENYGIGGLKKKLPDGAQTHMWGVCPDRDNPNGILVGDICLFYTAEGLVARHPSSGFRENEDFIRWDLKEKED